MRSPQCRQRPRSTSQDSTGTLSRGEIGVSQPGQCEGGRTTDSPRGTRQMTTLRKEPMTRPRSATRTRRTTYTSPITSVRAEGRPDLDPDVHPVGRRDRREELGRSGATEPFVVVVVLGIAGAHHPSAARTDGSTELLRDGAVDGEGTAVVGA